jgi:ubiquinone/menaquinone biosynthesis C-methylase UbiE
MENERLYQMNPQERFNNRAKDYAEYRPSYPSEAIDCILEGLGEPNSLIAADIGAGTGISSRLLADRGIKVIAIEPSANMRQEATPHLLIQFEGGSAENSKLEDNSVNLVTCFQAFHWFDPEPTLSKFARILKPRGKLAAIWNNRDRMDRFTREYGSLMKIAANTKPKSRKERIKSLYDTALTKPIFI